MSGRLDGLEDRVRVKCGGRTVPKAKEEWKVALLPNWNVEKNFSKSITGVVICRNSVAIGKIPSLTIHLPTLGHSEINLPMASLCDVWSSVKQLRPYN